MAHRFTSFGPGFRGLDVHSKTDVRAFRPEGGAAVVEEKPSVEKVWPTAHFFVRGPLHGGVPDGESE